MNPFMLVKGEWRRSLRGVLAVALVLGLALSLGVGVGMTERAVRQGPGTPSICWSGRRAAAWT